MQVFLYLLTYFVLCNVTTKAYICSNKPRLSKLLKAEQQEEQTSEICIKLISLY